MIKAIDEAQCGQPPELSGVAAPELVERANPIESVEGHPSNSKSDDTPLLTSEEKRRILARIARVNPLDCFDDTGAFDMARAKRILPPGATRHIAVYETTRLDAEGQPVTQRRVHLRLVDPLSALRLDDLLEKRLESTASPNDPPKNFDPNSRRVFNLLRDMTMGRDDALATIERLKKDLAAANKELDEKIHQLELTQRLRDRAPTSGASPSTAPTQAEVGSTSVDIGGSLCSSVSCIPQLPATESTNPAYPSYSPHTTHSPAIAADPKSVAEEQTAEPPRRRRSPPIDHEMEHMRNTSGDLGFHTWLRINRPEEWAKMNLQPHYTPHQKTSASQSNRPSARPPP